MNNRDGEKTYTEIEIRLQELEKKVTRLEQTVYGNGSNGLVQRLARLEERMNSLQKQISTNTMLTAGTFLSIIITLITLLIQH